MSLPVLLELLLLAALWGASFLFMRIASPEFGPVPLTLVRMALGAALLLPALHWQAGGWQALRRDAGRVAVVGVLNSAIPISLFAYATLTLHAGYTSILNATAPLWGALIGYLWLRIALDAWRVLGLLVGFGGVVLLALTRLGAGNPWGADLLGVAAGLTATCFYGYCVHFTRRYLNEVPPMVNAAGSQLAAALSLAPFGLWLWPAQNPGPRAWGAAVALGVLCTSFAYLLYFRLIRKLGPQRAISVTYLIPLFGVLWGALVLDEAVSLGMVMGGLVVLLGTAMASGLLRWPARPAVHAD